MGTRFQRARSEFAAEADLTFTTSAYQAATDVDAVLVLTDWEEFAALDLDRLPARMRHPILLDGRNLFSTEQMEKAGFIYYGVGRAKLSPNCRPETPHAGRVGKSSVSGELTK